MNLDFHVVPLILVDTLNAVEGTGLNVRPTNEQLQLDSKQTKRYLENIIPDAFLVQGNGGIIMNTSRFTITTVVENGYPHYKIYDNLTDNEIHCDLNELNETIWELLGV